MADASLIMATPGEVAARDGVTKQAVTKLVRRLVDEHDLPVERDGRERIVRFSLAHYDHLRGEFASSAKVTAARKDEEGAPPSQPLAPSSNSRDEALRQEAWLKVGREKIRQQEEAGQLVRTDMLVAALMQCGAEIRAVMARLQNKADDLALAGAREGAHGIRVMLRQIAYELGGEMADKLAAIGKAAPETDAAIRADAADERA